jgi:uncharacterized protein (TIGR02246 family)
MMPINTPSAVIHTLINAVRDCDVDAVVELFAEDAVLAVYPGSTGQGKPSIRSFFQGLFKMNPKIRYEFKDFIEAGDLALFTAKWTILSDVSQRLPVARTNYQAIVLQKQPDGNWLIVVDNPFGGAQHLE